VYSILPGEKLKIRAEGAGQRENNGRERMGFASGDFEPGKLRFLQRELDSREPEVFPSVRWPLWGTPINGYF